MASFIIKLFSVSVINLQSYRMEKPLSWQFSEPSYSQKLETQTWGLTLAFTETLLFWDDLQGDLCVL